ncbi:MAG: 5-(carboxyamino)imidazole ribonucleotide mutase [Bdellovibrio sp.]|nr:5-(carboxyamino)imidazole ribonucleotide mutase [Bdellovibrio sp.]
MFKVAILMGSDSDLPIMEKATVALKEFKIPFEVKILSAHRTPNEVAVFAKKARKNGFGIIIAGAGGAAHLPGFIAAYTELPVIGVPVPTGHLEGYDALLSIVQMPQGVPVATVAIGNAYNAGILAAQILGLKHTTFLNRVAEFKKKLRKKVLRACK